MHSSIYYPAANGAEKNFHEKEVTSKNVHCMQIYCKMYSCKICSCTHLYIIPRQTAHRKTSTRKRSHQKMYTVCKFIAKCIHAKYVHALIYILSRGKWRTEKLPRERGHIKKCTLYANLLQNVFMQNMFMRSSIYYPAANGAQKNFHEKEVTSKKCTLYANL